MIARFNAHMKCIEVENANELLLVTYHEFYRPGVLHTKSKHGKHYLIEKDLNDVSF